MANQSESDSMTVLKSLREETGFGIMDIKRALDEANGDVNATRVLLKQKSAMVVEKKSERVANQGLIETYLHLGRIGAMVEVNCETDFVARNEEFKTFVHNLVLHIAAMSPADLEELLNQPFFNDDSVTVREVVNQLVGKIGENIQIKRFARFELGTQ